MASAKKCDICGELYEEYNIENDPNNTNGIMFLNLDYKQSYFNHKPYDCCPKCMAAIRLNIEVLKNMKSCEKQIDKSCETCNFKYADGDEMPCVACGPDDDQYRPMEVQ